MILAMTTTIVTKENAYPLTQNDYFRKTFWSNLFWKITKYARDSLNKSFFPAYFDSARPIRNYEKIILRKSFS